MRRLFAASFLSTVLLASAAAATPVLVNGPYGPFYVADMMANAAVVAHPGVGSRVIGVLNAGERVAIIDFDGQWAHVQAGALDGFIPQAALR